MNAFYLKPDYMLSGGRNHVLFIFAIPMVSSPVPSLPWVGSLGLSVNRFIHSESALLHTPSLPTRLMSLLLLFFLQLQVKKKKVPTKMCLEAQTPLRDSVRK